MQTADRPADHRIVRVRVRNNVRVREELELGIGFKVRFRSQRQVCRTAVSKCYKILILH
jgi:hypothetical protein